MHQNRGIDEIKVNFDLVDEKRTDRGGSKIQSTEKQGRSEGKERKMMIFFIYFLIHDNFQSNQ